ncbi:hypothetical protein [Maricaulis sp.]|uniref:hypothetical protein n=1 Tax=Maricaulis sp. TaxID=1486257 RepID=UPI002B26ED82|nr:hypothetical protein [Maricaulis sp.]
MTPRMLALIAATGLAACSDSQPAETPPANEPAVTLPTAAEAFAERFDLASADHVLLFDDRETRDAMSLPDEFTFEFLEDDDVGRVAVRGYRESPAPHGRTQGISLRLADTVEQMVSGHPIEITVIARGANPGTEYRAAYSTNDVGNSGWRDLAAGPDWEATTFRFNVQPIEAGGGDFIGILPPTSGDVEIAAIAIRIAD